MRWIYVMDMTYDTNCVDQDCEILSLQRISFSVPEIIKNVKHENEQAVWETMSPPWSLLNIHSKKL